MRVNRAWSGEAVSYPFAAAPKQCAPQSLTLSGPNGPQAVQMDAVQCWPDTPFAQSGTVWFIVADLPPLATNAYALTHLLQFQKSACS
jgi:hypothetical protein